MGASPRRQKIEAMLADEPNDTFLRYSLALELEKEGEHDRSLSALRDLMDEQPPYVPAFFMSARQLVHLGRLDDAKTCLRDGMQQARQQGNSHAADEMNEMLTNLNASGS